MTSTETPVFILNRGFSRPTGERVGEGDFMVTDRFQFFETVLRTGWTGSSSSDVELSDSSDSELVSEYT